MKFKLTDELLAVIGEEIDAVIQQEMDDPGFLPQKDFATCLDRAAAGMKIATERATKVLALAIATHEENEHEADFTAEKDVLKESLNPSDVEVGTRDWWNQ
jgi:hypothetical protein